MKANSSSPSPAHASTRTRTRSRAPRIAPPLTPLPFLFWRLKLRKANGRTLEDYHLSPIGEIRREIHSRMTERNRKTGKGSKAFRKLEKIRLDFRRSGGFFLSDLIPNLGN